MAGTAAVASPSVDPAASINAEVLGDAPAIAVGNVFVATSYARVSGAAGEQAQRALAADGFVAGVHWATGQLSPSWLLPGDRAASS